MKVIATILAALAMTAVARARPHFVNLDAEVEGKHPRDYGYVVAAKDHGNYTEFSIALNPQARTAFREARVLILGDLKKDEIPEIRVLSTEGEIVIVIRVLTIAVSSYAVRVDSLPIADTDTPMSNFAGYNIMLKK